MDGIFKSKTLSTPPQGGPFLLSELFLVIAFKENKTWRRSFCIHCSAPCFWSLKIYFGDVSTWAVTNLLCVCMYTYTYSIICYHWMYCLVSPILTDLWFFPDYFIDFKLSFPPSRIWRNSQFYFLQGWWPLFVFRTLLRCS